MYMEEIPSPTYVRTWPDFLIHTILNFFVNPFVATKGTTDLRTKNSQHGNHVQTHCHSLSCEGCLKPLEIM